MTQTQLRNYLDFRLILSGHKVSTKEKVVLRPCPLMIHLLLGRPF